MPWIKVIQEKEACGELKQLYERMAEPYLIAVRMTEEEEEEKS